MVGRPRVHHDIYKLPLRFRHARGAHLGGRVWLVDLDFALICTCSRVAFGTPAPTSVGCFGWSTSSSPLYLHAPASLSARPRRPPWWAGLVGRPRVRHNIYMLPRRFRHARDAHLGGWVWLVDLEFALIFTCFRCAFGTPAPTLVGCCWGVVESFPRPDCKLFGGGVGPFGVRHPTRRF